MNMTSAHIWLLIALIALGTYLIRFSFLGLIGNRPLPAWVLRHLRYTPVAVLPGLVAPLVLWPEAMGGNPDPARLLAAAATVIAGVLTRNVLVSIFAGAGTLFTALQIFG